VAKQQLLEVQGAETVRAEFAKEQYGRAKDFFYSTPLAFARAAVPAPPPPPDSYASDDGTVQFHIIGQKPKDPAYSDIMNQNGSNLLGMGGLVYDYMHRNYPTVNSQKLDINTWQNVISNLPDLAIGKAINKTYNNSIAGVSVSGEFLSLIASAIITDGASLLADFNSFLGAIGDVVFSVHTTAETYRALTCTYQNYLVDNGAGGYFDYGAIVLRQIDFAEHFMELKAACVSAQSVQINMDYIEIVNLVQTAKIRKGGADYAAFQGLISAASTQQFSNAKNFFNGGNTPQTDLKPTS
jgi:hypothetical protein